MALLERFDAVADDGRGDMEDKDDKDDTKVRQREVTGEIPSPKVAALAE